MKDYYKILEIDKRATQQEIKTAYRSLAKKYHPDKSISVYATQLFTEVNRAYKVLSDLDQKQKYDQQSSRGQYHHQTYKYRPTSRPRRKEQLDLNPYVPYFRSVSWIGLVLSLFLCLDFSLPRKETNERIVKIENIVARHRSGGGRIVAKEVITTSGDYHIGDALPTHLYRDQPIKIYKTVILNISTVVDFSTDQNSLEYTLAASIYRNFSFAWIILLMTSVAGTVLKKSPEMILNLGIVNGILLLLVIYFVVIS